ncbi:LNS2-domain-containing protein [Backusella circina FSU 941]|nr:LNS2-domain-containing protein [Backusella circina FSU 941]
MGYVGKLGNLFSSLNNFYNEINPATLSGAIDIIVIKQANGDLACSPFHVRFGKLSVLRPQEKKVEIKVNGESAPYLMKVGDVGEAFFVFETEHQVPEEFQTSPILQALTENRSDNEEPPFLDINEGQGYNQTRENSTTSLAKSPLPLDEFEDEEDQEVLTVPPELQSPKMIIEEQMDEVVTSIDSYGHPQKKHDDNENSKTNDNLLLDDLKADAITTKILTKERFIVRPLNGDIKNTWMNVIRTSVIDQSEELELEDSKANQIVHNANEQESIVLDISGYKTEMEKREDSSDEEQEQAFLGNNDVDEAQDVQTTNNGIYNVDQEGTNKMIEIEPGKMYCIEISLCGFSNLGSNNEENGRLFKEKQVSYDVFVEKPSLLNNPKLVFRYNDQYFSPESGISPSFTSLLAFNGSSDKKDSEKVKASDSRDTYSYGRGWRGWFSRSSLESPNTSNNLHYSSTAENSNKHLSSEDTTFIKSTKAISVGLTPEVNHNKSTVFTPQKHYAKTLRLTSDQLKKLNLKKGVNTISFSVTSSYQGTATCVSKIFFWDYNVDIVISDIDGTITKSDALGHVFTMIGKDWTHEGIAKLYTDISNNGYHFIYLTSRAIGQADYTRDYLKKILQNKYQLPDGPVVMSPDRLFTSLHREVIMRKPEMFKMACLKDIQRLFDGRDPFYAGFGNRITDAISYRSVNVPSKRIFTIDPYGELKLELVLGFKSSYIHLNDMVDQMFPPISSTKNKEVLNEEYNDYNYWKSPMPEIDIPELDEEPISPTSPKPKPIKPDPTSLPKESVVAYTPEPKRGILRSFTSRSSLKEKKPAAVPTKSMSTPDLPHMTHAQIENKKETSDLSSQRSSPRSPSLMNMVIGGMFSRKSSPVTSIEIKAESQITPISENDPYINDLDAEIDELDLDDIPFI